MEVSTIIRLRIGKYFLDEWSLIGGGMDAHRGTTLLCFRQRKFVIFDDLQIGPRNLQKLFSHPGNESFQKLNSFLVIKFIVINKLVSLFESADKIRSYSTYWGLRYINLLGVQMVQNNQASKLRAQNTKECMPCF